MPTHSDLRGLARTVSFLVEVKCVRSSIAPVRSAVPAPAWIKYAGLCSQPQGATTGRLLPIQLPSYGPGRTQRAWLKETTDRHGDLLSLKCVMIILIIVTCYKLI